MRTFVYVDGESHYIRTENYWKKLHGDGAELRDISRSDVSTISYPDTEMPIIRLEPKGKFFWDTSYPLLIRRPLESRPIDGAIYYTDFSGAENDYHEIRVFIR